ncbi:MAG: hypothetical protein MJ105_00210 [Lachnospiraceae bacterium]|nr:hypothetical protein [Lachnospiraceae bacterium]
MRITNKVMQNNALTNINRNKELTDQLNTQLATGKKILRPSEDPVVAIRALRLASDVNDVNQYYKKNVPDAKSWLELTESAAKTSISVIKDLIEKCEKGSSDTLTTDDRKIIINAMKELKNEVYATGDADYAGRYIFTGYRTDTSLKFPEATTQDYHITQKFNYMDVEEKSFISTGALGEINEQNYENTGSALASETDVQETKYYRIQLAYDNLMDAGTGSLNVTDKAGAVTSFTTTTETDAEAAYAQAQTDDDAVIFVPSTGELVLGKNAYEQMKNVDNTATFDYHKEKWEKGDLRPQHYFACETTDPIVGVIPYNEDYPTTGTLGQEIKYQVGFNQHIQINSYPEEIFKHGIGRDVDEVVDLADKLTDIENVVAKLEAMQKDEANYDTDQLANIGKDLDAAKKAQTYLRDQLQKTFSHYITKMQGYLNSANEALTTIGNRASRLELVENRLEDQSTTFRTLQSENEDVDETEVAVQLSSTQVSYQAALSATADMIQKTLLDYL